MGYSVCTVDLVYSSPTGGLCRSRYVDMQSSLPTLGGAWRPRGVQRMYTRTGVLRSQTWKSRFLFGAQDLSHRVTVIWSHCPEESLEFLLWASFQITDAGPWVGLSPHGEQLRWAEGSGPVEKHEECLFLLLLLLLFIIIIFLNIGLQSLSPLKM